MELKLERGDVKIVIQTDKSGFKEQYFAFNGCDWEPVSHCETRNIILLGADLKNNSLVITYKKQFIQATKTIEVYDQTQGLIKVVTAYQGGGTVHKLFDCYAFEHLPDMTYAPSVMGFIPDAQYKAPLILTQSKKRVFAIIPDVTMLSRPILERCHHAMVLDVSAEPTLMVGFCPNKAITHAVYAEDPDKNFVLGDGIENCYYLIVSASCPPKEGFRIAVRFHWKQFGSVYQKNAAIQQKGNAPSTEFNTSWSTWRDFVWRRFSKENWLSLTLSDGTVGGAVKTIRFGGKPAVYMTSWFNSVRTAFGMALYAKKHHDQWAFLHAVETIRLALNAPEQNGAFPCFVFERDGGLFWGAGDGCGVSTPDGYLGYDMCWTGYWLLRWAQEFQPYKDEIIGKCKRLGSFMMRHQRGDGQFPTFFYENGRPIEEKLSKTMAETGPVSLFLLTLYQSCHDNTILESALLGLAFLESSVISERKWYDFETFWSCSTHPKEYDAITGQYPANNLALIQTVDAFLSAYTITRNVSFLTKGEMLLDYLLLYQQCWTNPTIDQLSCENMLIGGFTTQNTDAEWSDARQSQCGNVLMRYYRATNKTEYLQRGIAALRAQFPVCPSENWAHIGYGGREGISSFHWGTGSGMAGIEIEDEFLRDGVVDVAAGVGVGVNGIDITNCHIADSNISFEMTTPFSPEPKSIMFLNLPPDKEYTLSVNESLVGCYTSSNLAKGISLTPKSERLSI